ncbi:hypothetical protein KKF55_01525 [Patescibacteria group bacterium]|nr:hypothetical protein [Patescibacteria group bacterium]
MSIGIQELTAPPEGPDTLPEAEKPELHQITRCMSEISEKLDWRCRHQEAGEG